MQRWRRAAVLSRHWRSGVVLWQWSARCVFEARDIVSARDIGAIAGAIVVVVRPWRCGLRDCGRGQLFVMSASRLAWGAAIGRPIRA
jgi:hypothetical protein